MLALVADLARRMAQGNPHLEDPLQSEAVVLIDEIDLHLHPSWQQKVLTDFRRTFPNAQFIISTHSPQVLTTVKPEDILELRREGNGITAGLISSAAYATYGAEAGNVLETVMGVARGSLQMPSACDKSWKSCRPVILPLTEPTSRSDGANCFRGWASPDETYPGAGRATSRSRGLPEACWRPGQLGGASAVEWLVRKPQFRIRGPGEGRLLRHSRPVCRSRESGNPNAGKPQAESA